MQQYAVALLEWCMVIHRFETAFLLAYSSAHHAGLCTVILLHGAYGAISGAFGGPILAGRATYEPRQSLNLVCHLFAVWIALEGCLICIQGLECICDVVSLSWQACEVLIRVLVGLCDIHQDWHR